MDDTSRKTSDTPANALVPYGPAARAAARPFLTRQHIVWAAGFLGIFGIGAAGTHAAQVAWASYQAGHAAPQVDATAQTLRRLQEEVARLKGSVDTLRTAADAGRQDESLRTLKHSVETLKADIQQARTADGSSLQQIAAKLADHDPNARLSEIVARLDRIEHPPKPVAEAAPATPADAATRPGRPVAAVPAPAPVVPPVATAAPPAAQPVRPVAATAPAPPAAPVRVAAAPAVAPTRAAAVTTVSRTVARPDDKIDRPPVIRPPLVDAWVVRDVYDGMALVEARRGGLREVQPGAYLPGAGQVRSIERRGRDWVVLTSRGVIEQSTF